MPLSSTTARDPFSLVYNGLWALVERNQDLKKYIPAGNRINFAEELAYKEEVVQADLPELALLLAGGSPGTKDSSDGRSITKRFVWALTTGQYQVNPAYHRIAFELWRSMVDYACVLCALSWCNCNFVTDCRMIDIEEGTLSDFLERNITIHGWSGLWGVEVDMQFPLESLKIKNPAVVEAA